MVSLNLIFLSLVSLHVLIQNLVGRLDKEPDNCIDQFSGILLSPARLVRDNCYNLVCRAAEQQSHHLRYQSYQTPVL